MTNEINRLNDLEKPLITEEQNIVHRSDEYDMMKMDQFFMVLLSTFVAVCGAFEIGTCVSRYSAPTQAAIREDLGLSLAEFAMFGSILTIGQCLVVRSQVVELQIRLVERDLWNFSKILIKKSENSDVSLDLGRFATGCGIGIFSYVVPIFIAEIAPKNLRGGLTTLNQLLIVIGQSTAFLIGTVISWRELALAGLLPCIVLFVGLCFIPESPRWLVGNQKEFHVALRKLRGKDAAFTEEAEEIQEYIETLQSLPKTTYGTCFRKQYISHDHWSCINGVPTVWRNQWSKLLCKSNFCISWAFPQQKLEPLHMLVFQVSSAGTFLGCFLAGTSFYFKEHDLLPEWRPILAVAGVLIFPINVKGVAGSLVVLVNWLGAWAVSYTFNFMMTWSSYGTFYIYSGVSIITILFVVKFVPETKGKHWKKSRRASIHIAR
ncbi:hypothetical protein CXB51_025648 [Gossypium anomalum]|uniref:Major facilitator superfamily (MFS) profile domain-containing protein n=1 Tax=Gossypium anomalum TaxID=47600 RepID=A0A8J5YEC7_9ROSI|nr:hypothetical protein CXB51_025648 [Gossypium anomalum]